MQNPYKVLGLSNSASTFEIKQAFRILAKKTHPDLNGGDSNLTQRFREIAEAYAILSDPIYKKEYDSFLSEQKKQSQNKTHNNDNVKTAALNIENFIHLMREQVKPYQEAANNAIFEGLAWLIGGLLITGISYAIASSAGGGRYVVATGAILGGGLQALQGFYRYFRIKLALASAEKRMWESLGV